MRVAILATDNREHYKDYGAPAPYFGTAPEALLQGFALLPEVEVHVVSCIRQKVSAPAKIAPNVHFHSLQVRKWGWIRTGYQGCIRATRSRLKEIRPELVHAQGTERDCAISAVYSGFPSIVTVHGNMRRVAKVMRAGPFSYLWLAARLEAYTLPRAGGVLCITSHARKQVEALARRTWLVPNAVDASFFEVARENNAGPPIALCIGQIYSLKNQLALIEALEPLATRHEFKLEFLGEAKPGQSYAEEFLTRIKSLPWCVHSGFADRAKLRERLSRASLLIHPSLEDNCPMAVLEAMAAGLPVIASNIGGLPDLVAPGSTGWLCDPGKPETFTEAMREALQSKERTAALGREAKQRALATFHPRIIAQKHLQVYSDLLR